MNTPPYFVTMTDWTNLWQIGVGWVKKGKIINKLVIPCQTIEIARRVVRDAKKWKIYNNIRIGTTKPHYNPKTHKVLTKDSSYLWIMPED